MTWPIVLAAALGIAFGFVLGMAARDEWTEPIDVEPAFRDHPPLRVVKRVR